MALDRHGALSNPPLKGNIVRRTGGTEPFFEQAAVQMSGSTPSSLRARPQRNTVEWTDIGVTAAYARACGPSVLAFGRPRA